MIASLTLAALVAVAHAHRTVSTHVPQAQTAFDNGLTALYAYDREGAQRAFASALQSDPHLAIAAWGEALAAAGDLNHSLSPDNFAQAQHAAQLAQTLKSNATPLEAQLIAALALRYAGAFDNRETNEQRYIDAMEHIVAANPLDDDVAVVTAEALLEDGEQPARAIALLDPVLLRHPNNIMANHLCIHAYERTDPKNATACADRLNAMTFAPPDEHLAHMPAHNYMETGAYAKALAASETAWRLRESWQATKPPYELEYAAHDALVGYSAAMMLGDESAAQRWGTRVTEQTGRSFALLTLARFAHWDRIIAQAQPQAQAQPAIPETRKNFALGLAYARTGNIAAAKTQLESLRNDNSASEYASLLDGAIDEERGDFADAAASYQRAIASQKDTYASEYVPLFPAGEMLGAMYVRAKRYADARDAYEQTLARYPDDPRALAGLALVRANLPAARPPNRR